MSFVSLASGISGPHENDHTWALVLAGGEGSRLRQLTTTRSGTAVPKQFCSLAGGHTLLEEAITRAHGVVTGERICTIVAHQHRRWWSTMLAEQPGRNVIVQPRGRGTGFGILYSVLHIAARDPQARILVLPADHHVRDELILRQGLRIALNRVEQGRDCPVLVGLEPDRIDPELGYILPGTRDASGTQTVARFLEKPDFTLANTVVGEGALWNTFIFAASAQALINLFMDRYAALALEMQVIVSRALQADALGGAWPLLVDLYERLPMLDFSSDVLQGNERNLRVLRVPDCGWSDLGTPGRVAEILRHLPPEYPSHHGRDETVFVNLATQHALYAHRAEGAGLSN
ncbi:MAG TPA: sugar phosphate nucleotidyltransferase [Povalibacter sp.]|nr:sugar phosphate nucleotidyltransferase [Povalibacter sp.]